MKGKEDLTLGLCGWNGPFTHLIKHVKDRFALVLILSCCSWVGRVAEHTFAQSLYVNIAGDDHPWRTLSTANVRLGPSQQS